MPVYRIQRTETVYIEAESEGEADAVYGILWDEQETGDGAQGGRLGGEYSVEVSDHTPDFRAARRDDYEGGLWYESCPGCGT